MIEQIRRVVACASEDQSPGPRLLFSLALTTAALLVGGVGGSVVAYGRLPHSLSTMISASLMVGIVIANSVQIAWEATHSQPSSLTAG